MNNLKLPAYPFAWEGKPREDGEVVSVVTHNQSGFTKLELASLMMAGNMVQTWGNSSIGREYEIAAHARALAEAVLEEANK